MYDFDKQLFQKQTRMAGQLQQIAWAAPQVMALRTLRMTTAGAKPSARDKKEFTRMWTEKSTAFGQGWWSMMQEGLKVQQRMAMQALQLWSHMMFTGTAPTQAQMNKLWESWGTRQLHASMDMGNRGLTPVRKRVVSNAKRLSHTR